MGFGLPRGGLLPAACCWTRHGWTTHQETVSVSVSGRVFIFLSCVAIVQDKGSQTVHYLHYSSKGRTEAKDGSGQGSPLFFFFEYSSPARNGRRGIVENACTRGPTPYRMHAQVK